MLCRAGVTDVKPSVLKKGLEHMPGGDMERRPGGGMDGCPVATGNPMRDIPPPVMGTCEARHREIRQCHS